jgi:hypothetical protein
MGNVGTRIMSSERGETNLKLEAQKIKDFTGGHDEWQKWKSRTECAFSGSGYERVLEEAIYAERHPRLNKVVYSQLSAATVDGTAYHLVQEFEATKNGHAAWVNICNWYDGDMIQNETAENIRVKLENLTLHTGSTGSEYVNKFLAWYRDLEKIPGEGYSKNHAVYLFLKNISDTDYQTSVTFCRNTNANLEQCIAAIRKQERDLQQKRLEKRRFKATLRRVNVDDSDDDESVEPNPKRRKHHKTRRVATEKDPTSENKSFEGELATTERGLLRFHGECWKKMEEKEKEFVREYNASVKHGESLDKVTMPKGITVKNRVRRAQSNEIQEDKQEKTKGQPTDKKRKGIHFGLTDGEHARNERDE